MTIKKFWKYFTFQSIFLNFTIGLIYIIAGKLGLTLAFDNANATAVWAPTGIALVASLFFGYKVLPGIFLGAFIVNNLTAGTIISSFFIAIGNTLEAFIGSYLVKKFANGINVFENVGDIFKFVFLGAVYSTMVSATIGVTTLVFNGLAGWNNFWSIWTTWWLGDMSGNLIVAPFLLAWTTFPKIKFHLRQTLNLAFSFLCLFIVSRVVFTGFFSFAYLCIPVAIWIAFWFGQKGSTVATIFVTAMAIYYTLNQQGPFADQLSLNHSLVLVQLFSGILSLTTLIFAATVLAIKKGERSLAAREERFRALIENSFDAIVLIDITSKILYTSPSVRRVLGYLPEELIGTTGFDLVIPEDRSMTMRTLASLVLRPKGTVTIQYRAMRKDKKVIWVEATGTNLLFESGINSVVVNFHDITEEKIAEEEIVQEKMEDEAMLASIGDGVIATDNIGLITVVNQATCEALGWTERELIGKSLIERIPMEDETGEILPSDKRPLTKVLLLGKKIVTSPTNYYVRKDKSKFAVYFTVTPIILNKQIVGTIEVFHDITKEREVDKAKSEFVSIASHQLRTPLSTINWYMERIMKDKSLKQKQLDDFNEVHAASNRMVDLINSLLNASRLELGTIIVDPQKVDLTKIIDHELHNQLAQVKKKHIIIKKNYQKNLPQISADLKLLTIVIQNLISNAVKYNRDQGQIIIEVSYKESRFFINIIDNGFGIPRQQQSKIFTKLFRADNARSIEPEGNGLGLYIVKEIIESTGGKILFSSIENKGTTFSLSFPASGMKKKAGEKR